MTSVTSSASSPSKLPPQHRLRRHRCFREDAECCEYLAPGKPPPRRQEHDLLHTKNTPAFKSFRPLSLHRSDILWESRSPLPISPNRRPPHARLDCPAQFSTLYLHCSLVCSPSSSLFHGFSERR